MEYYALFYDVVDDFVFRRTAVRPEHLQLVADAQARGELALAGALADPADRALLIFLVDDKKKVEAFVHKDPYVQHGLVKKWEIRPWNVVPPKEPRVAPGTGPTGQIVRLWSARATEEKWPRYLEHFKKHVLPELHRIDGYLGATLYVRHVGEDLEALVATFWKSFEAIHVFAGVNLENAVVEGNAAVVLQDYDQHVRHYETVLTDTAGHPKVLE